MLEVIGPNGAVVQVTEHLAEDSDHFTMLDLAQAARFYRSEGYVVLRDVVSAAQSDGVITSFDRCVRNSHVPILRQKDMRYERNQHDSNGLLTNPLFNIQDLQTRPHGPFKSAVLDLLTGQELIEAIAHLIDPNPSTQVKLIQSMFFEAPADTWPHQDSYYQDSARGLGRAIATWVALEDIDVTAGRFYIAPRSHVCFPVIKNQGQDNFGSGHETYKAKLVRLAKAHGLIFRAPYLRRGDVLFWNSLTVHGSLPGHQESTRSRRSLTAHYLHADDQMLQFHRRIRHQKSRTYNGVEIGLLHDQDEWRNRMLRTMASTFPGVWELARRAAISILLKGSKPEATSNLH